MRKYMLMLVVAMPVILAGCNKEKVENLTSENVSLKEENTELETTLNSYLQTFNEIESNLAEIKKREERINLATTDDVEGNRPPEKAIIDDLKAINDLLAENKTHIAELQEKVKGSSVKISEFNKLVNSLQSRVEEKNSEINELKVTLASLNTSNKELLDNVAQLSMKVDTLNSKTTMQESIISEQEDLIASQVEEINTAYVATGSVRQLESEKVVSREGGVLGLGKVERLKDDFDRSAFDKIDISLVNEISLSGKKVELVTSHPSGSYKLEIPEEGDTSKLIITNPKEFWKSSRYLVAVVN